MSERRWESKRAMLNCPLEVRMAGKNGLTGREMLMDPGSVSDLPLLEANKRIHIATTSTASATCSDSLSGYWEGSLVILRNSIVPK